MLKSGVFAGGRPYLAGYVVIPAIDPSGNPLVAKAELLFLVDTGADKTMISPFDYETKLGLWLSTAQVLANDMNGIGGATRAYVAEGTLYLLDDIGQLYAKPVTFHIPQTPPPPPPGKPRFRMPNLLGADVWGDGKLTIDKPKSLVQLDLPWVPV
jgi:hypothetical protein